jgi:hypothetical protein
MTGICWGKEFILCEVRTICRSSKDQFNDAGHNRCFQHLKNDASKRFPKETRFFNNIYFQNHVSPLTKISVSIYYYTLLKPKQLASTSLQYLRTVFCIDINTLIKTAAYIYAVNLDEKLLKKIFFFFQFGAILVKHSSIITRISFVFVFITMNNNYV